jgi:hypothetical protein
MQLRLRCGVLVLAATLALTALQTASAAGGRITLLGTTRAQVALLEENASPLGRAAGITLLVRNDSKQTGRLGITFYPRSGGRLPLGTLGGTPFRGARPVFYSPNRRLVLGVRIKPKAIVPLSLRIGIAKKAPATTADGVLVVALAGRPSVRPAVVRVRGRIPPTPAPAPAPTPASKPAKVTLRITRFLPFGWRKDWFHRNKPVIWVSGTTSDAETLISSDSGGEMRVKLISGNSGASAPEGFVVQRVDVEKADRAGSYDGELVLRPDGSDKVTVAAKVQDLIIWPLLLLVIAGLIGGYGTIEWQMRRRRKVLRAEFGRALSQYRPNGSPIGPLDGNLDDDAIGQLRIDIEVATDADELDDVTRRVRAVRDDVHRWLEIEKAARRLSDLNEEIPEDADVVLDDAENALLQTVRIPSDATGMNDVLEQLRREARIVLAFLAAVEFRRRHPNGTDPLDVYGLKKGAYASEAATHDLLVALAKLRLEPQVTRRELFLPEELEALLPLRAERAGVPVIQVRSPEQIEREVRHWDWALALLTLLITALGSVITVYDGDFGSFADYAKVVSVGFLGQFGGATLWALFPALRSYRIGPTKPAA